MWISCFFRLINVVETILNFKWFSLIFRWSTAVAYFSPHLNWVSLWLAAMFSGPKVSGFTRAEATFQVTSNPSTSHHLCWGNWAFPSLEMRTKQKTHISRSSHKHLDTYWFRFITDLKCVFQHYFVLELRAWIIKFKHSHCNTYQNCQSSSQSSSYGVVHPSTPAQDHPSNTSSNIPSGDPTWLWTTTVLKR